MKSTIRSLKTTNYHPAVNYKTMISQKASPCNIEAKTVDSAVKTTFRSGEYRIGDTVYSMNGVSIRTAHDQRYFPETENYCGYSVGRTYRHPEVGMCRVYAIKRQLETVMLEVVSENDEWHVYRAEKNRLENCIKNVVMKR